MGREENNLRTNYHLSSHENLGEILLSGRLLQLPDGSSETGLGGLQPVGVFGSLVPRKMTCQVYGLTLPWVSD